MEANLRVGSTLRSKLVDELGAITNQMIRWLDRYFPDFTKVFPSFGKMALAALEMTPFPSDLADQEPETLLNLYRKVQGLKSPQMPKTIQLVQLARTSIGITEGQQMARLEIATLLRRYYQLEYEIELLTQQLTELPIKLKDFKGVESLHTDSNTSDDEYLIGLTLLSDNGLEMDRRLKKHLNSYSHH